jgi:hypothetical protein
LKKYVEKKVNELKGAPPKKKASVDAKSPSSGGIDMLDLSEVLAVKADEVHREDCNNGGMNPTETHDPFKGEDPTSKISCK